MKRWCVVQTYEVVASSKQEAKAIFAKAQRGEKTDREVYLISESVSSVYDGRSLYEQ